MILKHAIKEELQLAIRQDPSEDAEKSAVGVRKCERRVLQAYRRLLVAHIPCLCIQLPILPTLELVSSEVFLRHAHHVFT